MTYIFNDLSLNSCIDTPDKFKSKIKELLDFVKICTDFGYVFSLHPMGIYNSYVCGVNFRSCVNNECGKDVKSRIFSLIDRHTPSLPTDSTIPEGLYFSYNNKKIPCTGLAECAYQNYMDEALHSLSLSKANYDFDKLPVTIHDNDDIIQNVNNLFSLEILRKTCETNQTPITSWDAMIKHAQNLDLIRIENYVLGELRKEPFSSSLATSILRRLKNLSEIINAEEDDDFIRIFSDYCMRENANFSEESETKIHKYKEALTFKVRGEKTLCSYHGKIKGNRQFRIHMDGQPSKGQERTIVYIGYKITRD